MEAASDCVASRAFTAQKMMAVGQAIKQGE